MHGANRLGGKSRYMLTYGRSVRANRAGRGRGSVLEDVPGKGFSGGVNDRITRVHTRLYVHEVLTISATESMKMST